MIEFNPLNRDQLMPNLHFANIKVENDDSYFNLNTMDLQHVFDQANKCIPALKISPLSTLYTPPHDVSNMYSIDNSPTFSSQQTNSEGERSPNSVENYNYDNRDRSAINSSCIRGIQTTTNNPTKITKTYKKNQNKSKTGRSGRAGRNDDAPFSKEKDRAKLFNEAFTGLRQRIPSIPANKKLSKIEILRLAICYMSYLKFLVENDFPSRQSSIQPSQSSKE